MISSQQLEGCKIAGLDGAKGRVKDIYFNDLDWSVKYLVINLGGRTTSVDLLLSPEFVTGFDAVSRVAQVNLTMEQLAACPRAGMVKPVCQQYHYHPGARGRSSVFRPGSTDPCLRSAKVVLGYSLQGQGTSVGALSGFMLNLDNWSIESIQVEREVSGKKLLFSISPDLVERISFAAGQVRLRDVKPMAAGSSATYLWSQITEDQNPTFSLVI
ncbi:MAG: hypothetical protein ACO1QB_04760 [Verrucomicrobiales bacterium]